MANAAFTYRITHRPSGHYYIGASTRKCRLSQHKAKLHRVLMDPAGTPPDWPRRLIGLLTWPDATESALWRSTHEMWDFYCKRGELVLPDPADITFELVGEHKSKTEARAAEAMQWGILNRRRDV